MRDSKPIAEGIARQIQARTLPTWSAWGEDPLRRAVAVAFCEAIQKEFGWPNPHYLPDDPLRLLTWRTSADVELLFALYDAAQRLGVTIRPPADDFNNPHATLGQFVDAVVLANSWGPGIARITAERAGAGTPSRFPR